MNRYRVTIEHGATYFVYAPSAMIARDFIFTHFPAASSNTIQVHDAGSFDSGVLRIPPKEQKAIHESLVEGPYVSPFHPSKRKPKAS